MASFSTYDVFSDIDSNLYFRMHGIWTSVQGTTVPCPGTANMEHRRAYADDNNALCWIDNGTFVSPTGVEAPKHPSPRFLSADENGVLYVYDKGAYSPITLV
jgi:hypothetical protein